MTRLFLYGTLKRGGCRHRFLAGQKFLGEATTLMGFRIYAVADYPGLVRSVGGGSIHGELWDIDTMCLRTLDAVEGVAEGLFCREPIELSVPADAGAVEAYFYRQKIAGLRDCGACWNER